MHMAFEREIPQLLATNGRMSLGTLVAETVIADTRKLGTVMRTLRVHHIFAEPVPDVFTNDEASAALATDERLANSVRYASFLFPMADVLLTLLKDPVLCASYTPRDSAFAKSVGKGMGQFECLNAHFQWRDCFDFWLASLGEYLHGLTDVWGYPCELVLRNSAVVVDVVGGLGSSIQALRASFPEGREEFVGIQKTDPQTLATVTVKFTIHDFFNENPVKGADVYCFRSVIVDWQDDDLTTMFTHINNTVAPGKSRLPIGEYVMHPTCGDALLPEAPAPLLPNYGEWQAMGLIAGFVLTASPNGIQRTIQDLSNVVKAAGLKIVKVWICCGLVYLIESRTKEDV